MGILWEVECDNESGSKDVTILEKAYKFFHDHMRNRFELEHWYEMMKTQPK